MKAEFNLSYGQQDLETMIVVTYNLTSKFLCLSCKSLILSFRFTILLRLYSIASDLRPMRGGHCLVGLSSFELHSDPISLCSSSTPFFNAFLRLLSTACMYVNSAVSSSSTALVLSSTLSLSFVRSVLIHTLSTPSKTSFSESSFRYC